MGSSCDSELCWQRRLDHRPTANRAKVQHWQPTLRAEASVFMPRVKSSNGGDASTCRGTSLRADACSFVPMANPSNGGDVSACRGACLRAEACSFTPSLRVEAQPFVPSLRAEACPFVPVSDSIQYNMKACHHGGQVSTATLEPAWLGR